MQQVFEREYGIFWIDAMKTLFGKYGSHGYLFSFHGFCTNPNIHPEYVLQNPDLPWDWWGLCGNPNMDLNFILKNHPKMKDRWCYYEFVRADIFVTPYVENAQFDEIDKCILSKWWYSLRNVWRIGEPWNINWFRLSKNKSITFDFVFKYRNKSWNWDALSEHPNITFEMITANLYLPWNWDFVSKNPNVTMEIIIQNPDKPWNWKYVSANPNIDVTFLANKPIGMLDWYELCRNPAIAKKLVLPKSYGLPLITWYCLNETMEFMQTIIQKLGKLSNYQSYLLAQNSNLTLDFLLRNPCFSSATYFMHHAIRNPMTIDKNNYVETQYMRLILATIYEFYQSPTNYHTDFMLTSVEYVFADNFLVKMIICNVL